MAPKSVKPRGGQPSALSMFTSQENRPIVTAVGLFAVGVAFLHSSWSEMLIPY